MSLDTFGKYDAKECAVLMSLTDISGVGDKRAYELVSDFGSPSAVLEASAEDLKSFHYISKDSVDNIRSIKQKVQDDIHLFQKCDESDIWIRTVFDEIYPESLREEHCPLFIFGRGDISLLNRHSLSFSGSRDANDAACAWVKETAKSIASEGVVIVSGGARGIDKAAHQGALDAGGKTIVVSATGHNNPYPPEHGKLFEMVVEHGGALISHRPPSAQPVRHAFLDRNETNSALSQGIVIGAADKESGSMAQYRDAKSQEKLIFIPEAGIGADPSQGLGHIIASDYEETYQVDSTNDILDVLAVTSSTDDSASSENQATIDEF